MRIGTQNLLYPLATGRPTPASTRGNALVGAGRAAGGLQAADGLADREEGKKTLAEFFDGRTAARLQHHVRPDYTSRPGPTADRDAFS